MVQHNLTDPCSIKTVSPMTVNHGDVVTILGTNLQNIHRITFDRPTMFVTSWTGVSTNSTKHANNVNVQAEGRSITGLHIKIPFRTMTSSIQLLGRGSELTTDQVTVTDVGITFLKEINAAGQANG